MANLIAEQQFRQARISLIKSHAWWGALALRLSPTFTDTVNNGHLDVSATDGVHLFINPDDFAKRTLDERRTIIVHEVLHPAFGDLWRRGSRDPQVWNLAADIRITNLQDGDGLRPLADVDAINEKYLRSLGFRGGRRNFIGKTTEEVYDLLMQAGAGQSKGGTTLGGCGCCQPRPGDGDGNGEGKSDEGETGGGSPSDGQLEREWRAATVEAAIRAGDRSGALKEMLTAVGKSRVKWSDYLNEFLSRGLNGDSQWLPVNRRFIHQGRYFPSTTSIEVGEVVAIVDVSGSMSPTELQVAFGELIEFKRLYDCQLHIIQADAAVCDYKVYEKNEELPESFPAYGRGGTSFNPAFDYIRKNNIVPRLIVYFTDGEGSCTVKAPGAPVLWVQIPWQWHGSKSWSSFKPPFGEHIKVEI